MEEKKLRLGDEHAPFNSLVECIARQAEEIQNRIDETNQLSSFGSDIKLAEFRKQLHEKCYGDDIRLSADSFVWTFDHAQYNGPAGFVGLKIGKLPSARRTYPRLTDGRKIMPGDIKDFLLSQGVDWGQIGTIVSRQLGTVLPEIRKIQRNILYPEFVELEKEKTELEKKLEMVREQRNDIQDENNALIINLAQEIYRISLELTNPHWDKEMVDLLVKDNIINPESKNFALRRIKEAIEEFKEKVKKRKTELEKRLGDDNNKVVEYEAAILMACRKLFNTRSILGSKTLRGIREDLMWNLPNKKIIDLCNEMGIPAVNRHGKAVWPEPPDEDPGADYGKNMRNKLEAKKPECPENQTVRQMTTSARQNLKKPKRLPDNDLRDPIS